MICISVAPQSRTLAKVDLLNASRQGDMVELCLDHLIKDPDVGDLLSGIDKPVIVSCRRLADGGYYQGEEEHRITLLRQAIVAGPAYQASATATSQLPVVLTIDPSAATVCSIDGGGMVSFIGAGACLIDANQAGDAGCAAPILKVSPRRP